ncbi:DUF4130 domain-containing protein [Alkalibaculum sp. M08DMB]|uniref:DUF4130 domain-containing protein n=1 Tax=Alkalibaculum sporogenes TaxID=2655001 RepID=A0A6A7KBF9_9FIRM|nr:TIGR03915 family putative DNA repair protein [Alkalibaculum sporogenes]MPW26744.1 DUF4130 domain-containing protein [Alkalibaculum sporogenes]
MDREGNEIDVHYLYDDTFDGLLTACYNHYYKKTCSGIFSKVSYQVSLVEIYEEIETNLVDSDIMYRTIKNELSLDVLKNVLHCFLSDNINKEKYILDYLNLGFKMGKAFNNYHTHDAVLPLLQIVKKVKMESHRFLGYVRFTLLGSVLYCGIHPSFNILPIIADHFSDRFKSEAFIIHDKNRNTAIVSKEGKWVMATFDKNIYQDIKGQDIYEELWKTYFKTIGIESRKNLKLQQSFVPLKYRNDLLEFN